MLIARCCSIVKSICVDIQGNMPREYFCKLFNAKAILLEEQYWYYLTHSWEDKGVHTFPKGICPKMNIIARLEYELAYYDSVVHRFNHYTTRTPPVFAWVIIRLYIYIYIVLKTCLGRWTIGRSGERGPGISVLPARHDDDDIYTYIYIYIYIWLHPTNF